MRSPMPPSGGFDSSCVRAVSCPLLYPQFPRPAASTQTRGRGILLLGQASDSPSSKSLDAPATLDSSRPAAYDPCRAAATRREDRAPEDVPRSSRAARRASCARSRRPPTSSTCAREPCITREGRPGREFFVLIDGHRARDEERGRRSPSSARATGSARSRSSRTRPRTATVTATSAVDVLVITDRRFRTVVETMPSIALKVLSCVERAARAATRTARARYDDSGDE